MKKYAIKTAILLIPITIVLNVCFNIGKIVWVGTRLEDFGYTREVESYDGGSLAWDEISFNRDNCRNGNCVVRVFSEVYGLHALIFAYFDSEFPIPIQERVLAHSGCYFKIRYGYINLDNGNFTKGLSKEELQRQLNSNHLIEKLAIPRACMALLSS